MTLKENYYYYFSTCAAEASAMTFLFLKIEFCSGKKKTKMLPLFIDFIITNFSSKRGKLASLFFFSLVIKAMQHDTI